MMVGLVLDVFEDSFPIGGADAEGCVTVQPGKVNSVFSDPAGYICLEICIALE